MDSERQPLLGGGSSGNLPLRPGLPSSSRPQLGSKSLDPHRKLTMQQAAAVAIADDFRRRVPQRVHNALIRKVAAIRSRRRLMLEHDASEGELAEIIARTPDLEAIFQGEDLLSTPQSRTDTPHSLFASTLANSYGTLPSVSSRSKLTPHEEKEATTRSSCSQSPTTPLHAAKPPLVASSSLGDVNVATEESQPTHTAWGDFFDDFTSPVSKRRRLWLTLVFNFQLYNAIAVPFLLAFQSTWSHPHVIITLFVFFYIGDLCFCTDVVLCFFTPYTQQGMYERDFSDIRRHYLKTWFTADLISSVPFDLLLLPTLGMRAALLARFLRFLRMLRFSHYFGLWEVYSTRNLHGIRFAKLMVGLTLILHWLACFWFYCGHEYGMGTTTWLPPYEYLHEDLSTQYLAAFWWATNIITQVGGDPGLPTNNFERLADFFIAFLSVFVVAIIIGAVTELVAEASADEGELRSKLSTLNHFMYTRRLPDDLQRRIRNYYHSLWSRRGVTDGDTAILGELPSNLRTEVSLIMNQDILGRVPIFQSSSPGFINSLVLHLRPQTYMPKEVIVRQGDLGDEMFFISRGQVQVVVHDKVVGRIGEGGWFGEVAAIQENALRTATIVAVQFCDLFVLTHDDLQSLFRVFPAERAVIMHVAETRRAKDLLRKTLAHHSLLAREQLHVSHTAIGAFEHFPVLVNLLIDLFQPIDLKALAEHNCVANAPLRTACQTALTTTGLRLDEHGELVGDGFDSDSDSSDDGHDSHHQEGVIFSPADEAHTIYFVGKGCIDIFAHPELEEDGNANEEDSERRDIVDGDDEDVNESDETQSLHSDKSVSDDDPDGPQHVIRLTEGHFFGAIASEHYRVSAVVPREFRTGGDNDAIIFALTSHDLPKLHDYYSSLPTDPLAPDGEHEGDRLRVKRALITWLQRYRTPIEYVKSMISVNMLLHADEEALSSWRSLLRYIASKTKRASTTTASASMNSSNRKPPLMHAFTVGANVSSMPSRSRANTAESDSAVDAAHHAAHINRDSPPLLHEHKPIITVSPASETPPIQVEPVAQTNWNTAVNSSTSPMPTQSQSSSPPMPLASRLQLQTADTSPVMLPRPPLHRTTSLGSAAFVPVTDFHANPFSPLLHRARQTRGSGEASTRDVSELLAEADMHHNTRHAALTRSTSSAEPPPVPTISSSAVRPSLDWLTSPGGTTTINTNVPASSQDDIVQRSRSVLSPPSSVREIPTPARPELRRLPSVPTQPPQRMHRASISAMQAQQNLLSSAITPSVSLRRLGRSESTAQPFSFLLSLPTQSVGGAHSPGLSPLMGPSSLTSPRSFAGEPAASPGQKRAGSGVSTPNRRPSVQQGASKRSDLLDRGLASLSSDDLQLVVSKASMLLLARLQQAQSEAAAAAAATALTSPPPNTLLTPAPRF